MLDRLFGAISLKRTRMSAIFHSHWWMSGKGAGQMAIITSAGTHTDGQWNFRPFSFYQSKVNLVMNSFFRMWPSNKLLWGIPSVKSDLLTNKCWMTRLHPAKLICQLKYKNVGTWLMNIVFVCLHACFFNKIQARKNSNHNKSQQNNNYNVQIFHYYTFFWINTEQ